MVRSPCNVAAVVAATALLFGCPSPRAPSSSTPAHSISAPADRALRIRIAEAEARRGAGVAELVELATRGAPHERLLAIRGLGRIGGDGAREPLRALLRDGDVHVVAAAASALGVRALLDEPVASEAHADEHGGEHGDELTHELVAALERVPDDRAPLVIEALGRAGAPSVQRVLRPLLDGPPAIATAAAMACARLGRRKIALDPDVHAALIDMTRDPSRSGAAVYALSRAHVPDARPALARDPLHYGELVGVGGAATTRDALRDALVARLGDEAAELRAHAIVALSRHGLVAAARPELVRALGDVDWRVAVEAVRALTGERGDDAGREAVAAAIVEHHARLAPGAKAHVVIEGLRALGRHAARPRIRAAIAEIAARARRAAPDDPLTTGWIACLSTAAQLRASPTPDLRELARCPLPDHLRLPLVGELVAAGVGSPAARRTAVAALLAHADARVRAAALPALVALWRDGSAADREASLGALVGALASQDAIVTGAAIEALPALYAAIGSGDRSAVDAAVIARAEREDDPELGASLLASIGERRLAAGADACRRGLGRHPVLVAAARRCLDALGEPVPAPPVAARTPPPVAVGDVIGKRVRWDLVTSRGPVAIELAPDVAPWATAAIVALTRRGFYDGLEIHRVVPGFVVQGGDPTMSGWGGPGFTLPAEPGSLADGPGFRTGGVGIADAGRDSGGSQWFVMHGPAAHLDGRYTWIGRVLDGQATIDALQIGDTIVTATVTLQ